MNKVARLRRKLQGLVEIGHEYFKVGDWDRVVDVLDGMERVEGEIRRAKVQARAETAARLADPDAPRMEIPEGAPSGWVGDPEHRARMSPTLLRRIAADDAREAAEAAREERTRAAVIEHRQEEAILERWREDVALGIADVSDLPRYQLETAGRTRAEAMAHYSAVQDAEDARMRAAAARYGAMCAAALGADGDKALAQLLEGDDKRAPVGRRLAREKGMA
jgi:hypothetical protein